LNEILSVNPIYWPNETIGQVQNKLKEFYESCEYEGSLENSNDLER